MATYQELRTRSQQVRDEQNIGGNTALRVGQLLMDIVKYFNDNDAAASEYLQQHFAMVNDGTHLLNWQQSPIVILHTMGETYDDSDFSSLSQGENYYRAGFIMEANGQGGGTNGETPKANVLYVNLANDALYTWNGASFDAITSGGGGGISGDDIIKNAYYSNGNLVLIIETESGDKTVTIPVNFDAQNYVPTSRTVNNKALSNNITLSQSDIPGLVAALAGKISGIKANGASTTLPVDQNGVVELPPAGSTISPATATPSMDGTANVGSSAKYAREDHVHPHDSTKADAATTYSKSDVDNAIDDKLTDVTVAAVSGDVSFFVRDNALCISTESFVTVTSAPTITKAINSDGTATITITHSNNSAIIEYSLDGGTTWQTYSTALTINTAGTHTIKARAQVSGSPMSDIVTDTVTLVSSAMPTLSVSKTSSDVTLTASGNGTVVMTVNGTTQASPYTVNRGSDSQTLAVVVTNKEVNKLIATLTQSVVVPKVTVISQKIQDFCARVTNDGGSLIWGDVETTQEKYDEHTLLLGSEPELDFLGYKGTKSAPTYLYSVNENCDADVLSAVYINDDGLIVASESKVGQSKANIKWTKYTGVYSTRFAPDITYNGDSRTVNRDFKKLYMSAANGFLNADSTVTNANYYNCLFGGIFNTNGLWRRVGNQDGVMGVFNDDNSASLGCYNSTGMTSFKIDRSVTPMTVEINGAAATSVSATYICGSRNKISHAYMQMKENSPMLVLAY